MSSLLVAVYGTLKEGFCNHRIYLPGRAPVWQGFASLPFGLYANAEYPMLVPSDEPQAIRVDVFEVDAGTIERLDRLEEPYDYGRVTVTIPELEGEVALYVHPDPPPADFHPVASGDWVESEASVERFDPGSRRS